MMWHYATHDVVFSEHEENSEEFEQNRKIQEELRDIVVSAERACNRLNLTEFPHLGLAATGMVGIGNGKPIIDESKVIPEIQMWLDSPAIQYFVHEYTRDSFGIEFDFSQYPSTMVEIDSPDTSLKR